jgi:hypothetical protein
LVAVFELSMVVEPEVELFADVSFVLSEELPESLHAIATVVMDARMKNTFLMNYRFLKLH